MKEKGKKIYMIAERGFDPRTSGLWAQHASTAPLCLYKWKSWMYLSHLIYRKQLNVKDCD